MTYISRANICRKVNGQALPRHNWTVRIRPVYDAPKKYFPAQSDYKGQ